MNALTHFDQFRSEVSKREAEIASLLPPSVSQAMFMTCAIMAVKQTPDLLRCNRRSLHTALTKAAQDGLPPDGRRAVIVPFKDKDGELMAGYIPMYQGILQRALELGDVGPINAHIVRENDLFEYAEGDNPHITHKRPRLGIERGEIVGAYAIFWVRGAIWHREVFDVGDIEKARSVSRAANGPAWRNWYEEMARIRPIRRGAKYVPMSEALRAIIEREDDLTDLDIKPVELAPNHAAQRIPPPVETPMTVIEPVPTPAVAVPAPVTKKRAPIDIGFAGLKGRAA